MCVYMFVFDHAFAANVALTVRWEMDWSGVYVRACVCVCVCACLWPAIKTMAPLRAFLGRLTETLMASDWINHACRRYTHTTHTHAREYTETHTLP